MQHFPTFFEPDRIGTLFYPDYARIAAEARAAGLSPAGEDRTQLHLLLIDMQVGFCHADGALFVPGAREDVQRTIEFIYRNASRISRIICSLDSHYPHQIFHPAWWEDAAGNHPPAHTRITTEDVEMGRWRPLRDAEWSLEYLRRLEKDARKQLNIWPYHVLIGSPDNALDPELWSAVFWHSIARRSQPVWLTKGSVPQTEHYSILRPEIATAETGSQCLTSAANLVDDCDYLFVAGEASSHCVLESVAHLVEDLQAEPDKIRRIHLMRDCMSPVQHPVIDFASLTEQQFAEFEKQGVKLVRSTDNLPVT